MFPNLFELDSNIFRKYQEHKNGHTATTCVCLYSYKY